MFQKKMVLKSTSARISKDMDDSIRRIQKIILDKFGKKVSYPIASLVVDWKNRQNKAQLTAEILNKIILGYKY